MTRRNYLLDEAADYLRLPIPTFRKYREEIGGSKLGRRWVFTEDELDKFLSSKRRKPVMEYEEI